MNPVCWQKYNGNINNIEGINSAVLCYFIVTEMIKFWIHVILIHCNCVVCTLSVSYFSMQLNIVSTIIYCRNNQMIKCIGNKELIFV